MILADSSVWIQHFRESNPDLMTLLIAGQVATHTFVIGELACGNLPQRTGTLHDLDCLNKADVCLDKEVLNFLETHQLSGQGIGYIDAHLLASAIISDYPLWTRDKRLAELTKKLDCAYP